MNRFRKPVALLVAVSAAGLAAWLIWVLLVQPDYERGVYLRSTVLLLLPIWVAGNIYQWITSEDADT